MAVESRGAAPRPNFGGSGEDLAPTDRSPHLLRRDPWVWTMALAYALLLAFYLVPLLPPHWLETLSWYIADPLLLLLVLGAISRRGSCETGSAERLFWQLVACGVGFWLLGSLLTSWAWLLAPGGALMPQLAVDVSYIGYYLMMIFAVELRPDRWPDLRRWSRDERLGRIVAVAFCLALLDYFVLIPSYLDRQEYDSLRPSLLLYLGLDLLLCLRFALGARQSGGTVWRGRYLALMTLFGLSALLEMLELHSLLPDSPVPVYAGTRWDVLWSLPFVALLVAVRLAPEPGERSTRVLAREAEGEEEKPGAAWGPVLLYALVPPFLHLLLHHRGELSAETLEARETLIIVYFLFAGTLALVQYRRREAKRQEAMEALRDSEDRYRQLVETAPDAILVEREGRVVYSNPMARRLLGAERLDLEPSFEELGLPLPSLGAFLAQADRLSPATLPIEHRLRGADGSLLAFEISYLWINYQGGVASQAILHDVSAERRLRDEAEQMEQLAAVGEFAATIAHEIRNPLASLLFNLRHLGPQLESAASNGPRLRSIETAAERMQAIIKGILEFSRGENPHWMEESLESIVSSALRTARPELEAAGIEIRTCFEPCEEVVRVDIHQMVWVFAELLTNARRAMTGGGVLEVSISRRDGDQLEVVVSDSGPGIAEEDRSRVLRPFFSTWPEGLGLGLARVAQILERHHCCLELGSGMGRGTRVRIRIPLLRPALRAVS